MIKTLFIHPISLHIDFLIGKSAQDNFHIIDQSCAHHLWFHIHEYSSAHVIAIIPENLDKKKINYIIKQGAILCKQISKYKNYKNIKIIYTNISNVIKTNIIGSVPRKHSVHLCSYYLCLYHYLLL